ncbi:MipA/OmpV family protein [Novosphingobium rosa]|uniref:MipA/OmpV family protein n=1 Tax=Novosphingobium rosa TaxID=76978 RepID=UPI000831573A|nr:MipA/OmpV family protein [Novosphingobium rosa]
MKIFTTITCATLALLTVPQARAQDVDAAAQSDAPRNGDHIVVGLGALYAPAYEGGDKYRALPLPAVDIKQGRFFANLRDGVGANLLDTDLVTVGASITYTQGYRSKDVPAGIGAVNFGAGARGFVSFHDQGVIFTLGATQGFVGGTKGLVADASLSYPVAVTRRLTVIPTLGTTWANAKFNNRYFGIDTIQAAASGLNTYAPGSGFKDASASLTASYRLTDHIVLSASGVVTTVLGADGRSPLVVHKTQPSGFLSMVYRF